MNPFARLGVLLAGAALIGFLAGCASGAGRAPTQSSSAAGDDIPRLTDQQLEQRAQALAAFSAGVVAQARDDTDAALAAFARSLELDPGNEGLAVDVGRRYLAREQPDKAHAILKRTAARPEASGVVHALLGFSCVQLGRTNEAIAAYRESVRLTPTMLGSYQALAQLHLQRQQPAQALSVLEQALAQTPEDAAYWVDLADFFGALEPIASLRETARKHSRDCLAKAEALQVTSGSLLRRMADRYLALGDSARGEEILKQLADEPGSDPAVTARLAEFYLRSGKLPEARKQFEELNRLNPANPSAAYFLGLIGIEERDFERAVKFLERTLLLNPDFAAAYNDLAVARMGLRQPQEAIETLDKARRRFDPEFRREYLTAMAQAELKQWEAAQSAFQAAEKLARENQPEVLDHRFYFQMGAMLERAGKSDAAVAALEKALSLKPDFDEALNHLGYMWAEQGVNLERAHDMIQRAVKAEPDNPAYLDSLGWVLFKLGKPTDALEWLNKAIGLLPEPDATVLDHLGDTLQALGRSADAKAAWQRSLAVEPNEAVKRKLETAP